MYIPNAFVNTWLKEDCQVIYNNVTLTTSIALIVPANPLRFSIVLNHNTGVVTWFGFGDQAFTSNTIQFTVAAADDPIILTADTFGSLITRPLWAAAVTTGYQVCITECAYQPDRYAIYRRMMHEWLAHYATPRPPA